jgi:hypothetical protein
MHEKGQGKGGGECHRKGKIMRKEIKNVKKVSKWSEFIIHNASWGIYIGVAVNRKII